MKRLRKIAIVLPLVIAPLASAATADQNARLGPDTIPGFFETTTGHFSPLIRDTPNANRTYEGDFNILPDFRFDSDFSKDDTVFCDVRLVFGNVVNKQFYPNHTAQVSVNFAAGDPDKLITVPYRYTANSDKAQMSLVISCRGTGDSGAAHSFTVYYAVEDVPDGDVTRTLTNNL
jgi:hypothetical protein